jgi:curved DNA-binding protein
LQSDSPDHYAILGLDRCCTAAQIRSAYRVQSKRHHPDLNPHSPEAAEHTRELNAAHEILSDPARRRAYDRELAAAEKSPSAAPTAKTERNIRHDALVRIEDLFRGTTLQVQVHDPANPHGAEAFTLELPPDTPSGTLFKLPRLAPFEGGFVQVRVKVRPGGRFKARGTDLRCDLRVSAALAARGGSEMIPGPSGGMLRVSIPARVGRGAILRVAGQGLPKPRGGRGDLLVRITYRPEVRISRAPSRQRF